MHRLLVLIFLLGFGLKIHGEEELAPRALPWLSPCEVLCANLTKAIQDRPDTLVMRLEDALVINEPCAAEIVTAAIDAVRGRPALVQQIMDTALKVAPSRSSIVMNAVRTYRPLKERVVVQEEVRRAETPYSQPLEIRRAEVASSMGSRPIEEIRRALPPPVPVVVEAPLTKRPSSRGRKKSAPREEIRRPEVILMARPEPGS